MTETIKIRGLLRIPAWIFGVWGLAVSAKGAWDLLGFGEPEANRYAPRPWEFVSQAEWARYAFFELCYGLACLALACLMMRFARFLPETLERPKAEPAFDIFR